MGAPSQDSLPTGSSAGTVTDTGSVTQPGTAGTVDQNGDGTDELVVLYDYGSSNTGLFLFSESAEGQIEPDNIWLSGDGNWDWSRSRTAAADQNGDGADELVVLYDYGDANTGLFLFDPLGDGYDSPRRVWLSGAGNWDWTRSKFIAADQNGDGDDELVVFYNYGSANTGIILFDPLDTAYGAPRRVWLSGAGNWDWTRSKLTAADQNGDGDLELVVLYDYGSANTGLFLIDPQGAGFDSPRRVWLSGAGNWECTRSKLTLADRDGDGDTELVVFYEYGDANTGLIVFEPLGVAFDTPQRLWLSGAGNWEWNRSKAANSDTFRAKYALIIGILYGSEELGGVYYCDQDATSVYNLLTVSMGFPRQNVVILRNGDATYARMVTALDWLVSRPGIDLDSDVVFYYSGHGVRNAEGGGYQNPSLPGYALVPSNFDVYNFRNGQGLIFDQDLASFFSRINPGRMWITIDSCFAGGFARPGITGPNRIVTLSSQAYELSEEFHGRQRGAFTQFLIEEGVARGLSVEQSFGQAAPMTALYFGQHPVIVDNYPGYLDLRRWG